jgi:hypothetical protein
MRLRTLVRHLMVCKASRISDPGYIIPQYSSNLDRPSGKLLNDRCALFRGYILTIN